MAVQCDICYRYGKLNESYDAYYCEACDEWLERDCGDPECHYCVNRSNKPSQV